MEACKQMLNVFLAHRLAETIAVFTYHHGSE